ncbi:hypothetical protein AB6A23_04065 [Paenibacillus tarimensis]
MAYHINDLFQACTPKEEQRSRMLREIVKKSAEKTEWKTDASLRLQFKKRLLQLLVAGMLCLLVLGGGAGIFSLMGDKKAFAVYAIGSDTEITEAGVELSTGIIFDDGTQKGEAMYLYVQGDNINTIRYTCKNQYMHFTDMTEKRQSYSMEKQFTVTYGEKSQDYRYLLVEWLPENTVRALSDADVTIENLSGELRNDMIVMEVTFKDGSTVTKAVAITIQDNGKILAKLKG